MSNVKAIEAQVFVWPQDVTPRAVQLAELNSEPSFVRPVDRVSVHGQSPGCHQTPPGNHVTTGVGA